MLSWVSTQTRSRDSGLMDILLSLVPQQDVWFFRFSRFVHCPSTETEMVELLFLLRLREWEGVMDPGREKEEM